MTRIRTVLDHKNPGYQKRNRLRMSPILHPTNFADFALLYKIVCCLAMARQQLYIILWKICKCCCVKCKYIYLIRRFVVKYRRVFLRVVPYFDEPVRRVKIQTTSKNSQRYFTTKRLIRDLLSNTPNFMSVRENFADIYLRGMPDRQKQAKRNGIGAYKYRVIFVLVLGVIMLYSTKCSWIIKSHTAQLISCS